jgi:TonB family protein
MKKFKLALTFAVMIVFANSVPLHSQDTSAKTESLPVYYVGGGVKPPRQIYGPGAEYTDKARKEGQEGVVVLEMVVTTDGSPRDIKVTRSLTPDLDEAALDAVRKWKFSPGTKDGEAVAVLINAEISFSLGNQDKHRSPAGTPPRPILSGTLGCKDGRGVKSPRATYMPGPVFSEEEKHNERVRHTGVAILSLVVSPEGTPREVKVARSLDPDSDQKAIETVNTWKFDPATRDCKPVAVQISVEVNFAND